MVAAASDCAQAGRPRAFPTTHTVSPWILLLEPLEVTEGK